jgi:hypothetical protein
VFRVWTLKNAGDDPKDPNKITYYLYTLESPTKAYELMHAILSSIGPGRLTQDYGEETEIWDGVGPRGETRIHFRIGNEVVFLGGPQPEITKRFARIIADALAIN